MRLVLCMGGCTKRRSMLNSGIFRFLLSWSFLGSVESVFVRMFWHSLKDVVCRY
jgi:hypothetical protein